MSENQFSEFFEDVGENVQEFVKGDVEIAGRKIPKIVLIGGGLVLGVGLYMASRSGGGSSSAYGSSEEDGFNIGLSDPNALGSGGGGSLNPSTDSVLPSDEIQPLDGDFTSQISDSLAPLDGNYSFSDPLTYSPIPVDEGYFNDSLYGSSYSKVPEYYGESYSNNYATPTPQAITPPSTPKTPITLNSVIGSLNLPRIAQEKQQVSLADSSRALATANRNPIANVVSSILPKPPTQNNPINRIVSNILPAPKPPVTSRLPVVSPVRLPTPTPAPRFNVAQAVSQLGQNNKNLNKK